MNRLAASLFVPASSYAAPVRALHGGKRAFTHLARMNVPGLPLACVKAFPVGAGNALFNEVAGFVVARHAGLDVAGGGLVPVPLNVIEGLFPRDAHPTATFASHEGLVSCFATVPISDGYGAIAVSLFEASKRLSMAVAGHLMGWDQYARCLAFDQWVGNWDRNDGNLLFGPSGRPIPIDHSDCFWGPDWPADRHHNPNAWTPMKAMFHLPPVADWSPHLRSSVLKECDRWVRVYSAAYDDILQMREWLPEPAGLHWMHWVWKRAEITRDLWAERLGMI